MVIEEYKGYKIGKIDKKFYVLNSEGTKVIFDKKKTCYLIIDLMESKEVPNSSFLTKAARELSLDQDYRLKIDRVRDRRSRKNRYININKGGKG